MVLFSPGCTQHALRPSGQASCQSRGGTGGANGHQAWAAFGHVHGVVKVGRIGPLHGLREVGHGARVARQDALGWHRVAAFAHAPRHTVEQAGRVVQRHDVQRNGKAVALRFFDQCQFGRVGEHGFTCKRRAICKQACAARVGPGAGGFRALLGIGDVLQILALVQVGVHEFQRWAQ